jgi:methionine sulfoxide reductase heme-binding subunit
MTVARAPWLDYGGRFSLLKSVVFACLIIPALWVAYAYSQDLLGSRPLTEAIHQIGQWMIRFLFLSLAITPARQILNWPRLLLVRRMLGVAAACYGLIHISIFAADEAFDLPKVAAEIVLRIYLTIGFVALSGLVMLASTSTDGMQRWLGGREWQKLHRLVYGIAFLGLVHYFMQSKLDEWQPMIMAGFYAWLMIYRVLARRLRAGRSLPVWQVGALSLGVGVATGLFEATYFYLTVGAPFLRVLMVNFSLEVGTRPSWVVLGMGAVVTIAAAIRAPRARSAGFRGPGGAPSHNRASAAPDA